MGARVVRMFRNFNLENGFPRNLQGEAERSAATCGHSSAFCRRPWRSQRKWQRAHKQSAGRSSSVYQGSVRPGGAHRRSKGKLTIAEALKALSSHQRHPQDWTPEKIAQEYSLDLKDAKALVEFFIPSSK
ncbi:hypothetical protein INR49_004266 [Caranx melampygus]|nr:hypothetical protein INR49_004266 [Caranx melampygus]